ncbi:TIGR01777 family oxidoreductase [Flavobacteriaceae bacterium M23B6Z8]
MKVLITGATGLVGSEIMRLCRLRNIQVNYLTTSKNKIEKSDQVNGFFWDPSKSEIDENCLEGVDTVINLAGASISKRWTESYKKIIIDSRLDSLNTLHNLLRNNSRHQVSSLVSASAIGVYPSSLTHYYTEDDNIYDDSFLCKVVKEWEAAADKWKDLGMQVTKIRIGLVLSKDGGALPQLMKPVKFYAGAPLGSGEQWQSWIHITDLAELFLYAVTEKLEGVYNGVAPNPVNNTKLTKEVAAALKKPLFLPNVPEWLLRAILGEMANILFDSQRVSSKKIENEGFMFIHSNVSGALNDLLVTDERTPSTQEFVS